LDFLFFHSYKFHFHHSLPSSILLNRTWFHFHGWKITSELKAIAILGVEEKYQTYFHLLLHTYSPISFTLQLKNIYWNWNLRTLAFFPKAFYILNHLYRHRDSLHIYGTLKRDVNGDDEIKANLDFPLSFLFPIDLYIFDHKSTFKNFHLNFEISSNYSLMELQPHHIRTFI
jgi:hypothetical protein